jgi:hypothetical protein
MVMKFSNIPLCCLLLLSILSEPLHAEEKLDQSEKEILALPYAFYSEFFGFAAAYVYGVSQFPQEQSTVLGTVMAGSNGSVMAWGMIADYQLPFARHVFMDAVGQYGDFQAQRVYSNGNPDYSYEEAGSHDSHDENYIEGSGTDAYLRARFRIVLPLGFANDSLIKPDPWRKGAPKVDYVPPDLGWAFWEEGYTFIELMPFWREQEVDADDFDFEQSIKTNGFEVSFFFDNRDAKSSPSAGGSLRLKHTRDFGWGDSTAEYQAYSLEIDKYFALPKLENYRQNVLAFDLWYADTPTWDDVDHIENGEPVFQRSPSYAGASLGGLFRLRGFPSSRYNDRSAVYYGAEWRVTPVNNVFDQWAWIQKYVGVEWVQWVAFAEAGRVHNEWDFSELHSDMNFVFGGGMRLMAKGIVIRAEAGLSDEGVGVQMMIGQPFAF